MRIGYLGPKGTFTEYSALVYTKQQQKYEFTKYQTIHDVLVGVDTGEIQEGIVPFENSIEGTVTNTLDTLIFDVDLFIKAEVVIAVSQNLMVKKENENKKITKILSHPQGLAQCNRFIREFYADCDIQPVNSTAEAAKIVSDTKEPWGAIALKHAATVYNLSIIHEEIQDMEHNQTRFVVVTKDMPIEKKENIKTSIAFSTENKPGGLYKILDILAIWDLNMTKIESRPMKNKLGSYVFFVDLETEFIQDMKDALKMIERKASYFKYLGSYPVFK